MQSETFLIVGYEPSAAALGGIGRLLLAAYCNYGLAYVGSVGTGFTQRSATDLRRQLDRLKTAAPPVRATKKGVAWTKPTLAAENCPSRLDMTTSFGTPHVARQG